MAIRSRKVEAMLAVAGGCSALIGLGGAVLGCPVATKYGGPAGTAPLPEPGESATPAPQEPPAPVVKYGGPPPGE